MTLVLGTELHQGGPQTHVLIIGVGRYTHLLGGAGPVNFTKPPLGQLKSPPVSARALADWFTSGSYHNDLPLGSVEILLSDAADQHYQPPGAPASTLVDPATMSNIEAAFDHWEARCNAHVDNIAIFYFCGHGLQKETMVLLPEDFAKRDNNPWEKAIDFNRTYRGMALNAARTQYYVIDACRQWSTSLLQNLDVGGETLMQFIVGQQKQRSAPTLFATGNGLPAFGDTGGVSRLTAALLTCLKGSGADKQSGVWVIDTDHLGAAVKKLIDLQNTDLAEQDRQIVDPTILENTAGPRVLHRLSAHDVPLVSVPFLCLPEDATAGAMFFHVRGQTRQVAPATGPWLAEIPAGVYDFGADFQDGKYTARPISEEFVRPPVWPVCIQAEEA